ncbi:FAST kinase domain-containing protein 4 [Hemicordylus capensis]|uniref:FAST kinase domain-containing protein 4 n=1 Tax=Hemicordylus capensis TaxID=884348 RepID=UPI002303FCDE|nr:FAST kinase domain-containing protein 4 [Hemicordylus capensis]XP_053121196.1 FAST kinase domain-containing protein 4 [Hemicordylus capensis]
MAAKLMYRWYRLFRVLSPLCAQANAVSTGGKTVIARVSSQAPLASLTVSNLSSQTDKLSAREQLHRTQSERSELEDLIGTASTTDDLFHLGEHYPINANQAALIITQLSRKVVEKKLKPESILEDARFQHLLQTTNKQLSQVWNMALVNLLRSLHFLGLDRSKRELQSVEQEMRWRLRRMAFKHLVSLAEQLAASTPRGAPSALLSDLVKQLELRWTEIEDTRTVVGLMAKVGSFSPALMDRLEEKGLEFAEQFNPEDTRKIAMALALQNRRSIPLLRAISYHLVQKHFALSTSILLDLAFAYGKLNFHQTQVFQKIALDLHPRVPELSPGDVVRCIKSFAYLKWLNLPLFEAFAQYASDNANQFTPAQLSNVVLAFARLNFQPRNEESFYGKVNGRLDDQLDTLDRHLQLDLVWSLCVLQQAKAAHLRKVLAPEFHTCFFADRSAKGQNYLLKLIHINTTARLECADYQGALLPLEALDIKELLGDRKATPLQTSLREVLKQVVGDETMARFEVDTVYGWQIDAEMVLNSDVQPLPIAAFDAPHLAQSEGSRPLPPGAKRLAFLRWEFPNFSNRSKDLLGRFVLARRHLQAAGFLIVDVPYYEWLELKSERQKAACLRDKMNKAVAEDMAK